MHKSRLSPGRGGPNHELAVDTRSVGRPIGPRPANDNARPEAPLVSDADHRPNLSRGVVAVFVAASAAKRLPNRGSVPRIRVMRTPVGPVLVLVLAIGFAAVFAPAANSAATIDYPYPPSVPLEDIRTLIGKAPREHPRLFATGADLTALRQSARAGSLRQVLADEVVRQAVRHLDEPPAARTLQGRRLLGVSRTALGRVSTLATAFHQTGRREFAERARREMLAMADFEDWNPSHFLDVGEMSLALAIGYDWLYHELDEATRVRLRTALVDKALRLPFETRHNQWVRSANNWGQVCHGGLTAAALAVLEHEPDWAARTVHAAVNNVRHSMDAYAPNGSYPEGPGYWSYGTSFNVLLIAALESVLGTDFGLSRAPGFDRTGQYPALVTGPSGLTFNYADGGSRRGPEPVLHWFARRYGRGDWLRGEPERIRARPGGGGRLMALTLLWLDESLSPSPVRLPLHWQGDGPVPICLHRTGWEDATAVFVGFKGGSPSANHGNMDIGSFVLDAQGVRWALDLGAEDYYRIESRGMNLWDRGQNSERWTVFRQMNHAHNTLVIDDQLQRAAGFGRFERFSDRPDFPCSILDLTPVYEGQAASVRRGIALLPSGRVVVQDELTGLRPGARVRWGMITPATPGDTGTRSLRLRQGDQTLRLDLLAPAHDTVWTTLDTARPRREWDSPNPGTILATFTVSAPADGTLTLRVVARPGDGGEDTPDADARPLADWR